MPVTQRRPCRPWPLRCATGAWRMSADWAALGRARSVDHLVGESQQARWKFEPERPCRCAIEHQLVFGRPVERNVTRLCPPQYLTCHVRNATHHVHDINTISHEAAYLDELTKRVDCRDMKSGGEVNNQLTVGNVLGRVAYDDTIDSIFFHQIESPLICSSINLFAANDNGIERESPFVCCPIKLSADNDKGHLNPRSLRGFAHVFSVRALSRLRWTRVGNEPANFRQFSRGFQEQFNALAPDFQSCIKDHSGEISIGPRQVARKPIRDRIRSWSDHWNAGAQRVDLLNHPSSDRHNDIWMACNDLACDASVAVDALTGSRMPLHDQISPFDKAELVQFVKVSLSRAAFLRELGGKENGNAFCDRRTSARLCMRPTRKAEGRGGRPRNELPP